MKFLLDTCVISDFVKGESNTLRKIKQLSPSDIAISTISVMEIQYGLGINSKRAEAIRSIIHDFLSPIHVLDFSFEDAKQAAMIRDLLKQQGTPIGSYDVLLAGTAVSRKLILVSANENEFRRVGNLHFENWRG